MRPSFHNVCADVHLRSRRGNIRVMPLAAKYNQNSEPAHLPAHLFACLNCCGSLVAGETVLRCLSCASEFAIRLGVPLLVKGCEIVENTEKISDQTLVAISKAYGLTGDDASRTFFEGVLAHRYHFADSALDSENNLLLQRLGLDNPPNRCATTTPKSVGQPHWNLVRHYFPAKLQAKLKISFNVRIRNTSDFSLVSNWTKGEGYQLVPRWLESAKEEECAPLPVSLPPGEDVTVPVYVETPSKRGKHMLQLSLRSPFFKNSCVDPVEVPINIVRPTSWLASYFKRMPVSDSWFRPVYGPTIEGYDADHHVAIRIVHEEAVRRKSRIGLEIGGCSTPMTTNLPCQIVSTDIDVQTLQVGRFVFARRAHTNVTFVCCDGHDLPFQPASFDFVAIFSALHHFSDPGAVLRRAAKLMRNGAFMAVMCEPVGHYRGKPDDECLEQMTLGVNEQRFSLAEYEHMFRDAGFEASSTQIDHDSLKCILQLRKKVNGLRRNLARKASELCGLIR